MQTIRARLSYNTLLALALGMSLAAALTWLAVSRLYINTQRENLLAQAELIAAALQGQSLPANPQPYSQAANTLPGFHTRLLTDGGAVVVGFPITDLEIQMPPAEQYAFVTPAELLERPEIISASEGKTSSAIRHVINNQRVMYAAAPIISGTGSINGIVYIATPLPVMGVPASLIIQLLGSLMFAIALAFLAGNILSRQISKPLEQLNQAADAVSRGDLRTGIRIESNIKEFDRLGVTFNSMISSLRQADEGKKSFLADVTHELRTPLTVIKGTIETLEDGALDDLEGRGALLKSMLSETDRLIRMVNELLLLTRADAGVLQLEPQTVDLVSIINERGKMFSTLAMRKSLKFRFITPSQPATIFTDPDRLLQVMDNLFDNAIRHAHPKTEIILSITGEKNGYSISVNNQGACIPTDQLPFIFERFYRVDKARDRKEGGAGLGLAIAKALIQAMGGRISARSQAGQGTTVKIWLPVGDQNSGANSG